MRRFVILRYWFFRPNANVLVCFWIRVLHELAGLLHVWVPDLLFASIWFIFHRLVFFIFENCMPTVHVVIKGRVQGVYFRASAQDVADEIGVTGWVKNTEEGNVEIMATGSKEQLEKLVEWCRVGPRRAVVTDVSVTETEETPFKGFNVIRRH